MYLINMFRLGGEFFVLIKDILKEFVFECEVKKMSIRTIRTYKTNSELFFVYAEREFQAEFPCFLFFQNNYKEP